MHEQLERHYGKGYLCHALADLHLNQCNSQVMQLIGEDPSMWQKIWSLLGRYAKGIFDSAVSTIQSLDWESVVVIQEIPRYLSSLLRVINQILSTSDGSQLLKLANAFFVGASKLWSFLRSLVPSLDLSSLQYQISAFGSLLSEYGSRFLSAMHILFKGFKQILLAVAGLYTKSAEKLGDFSASVVSAIYETAGLQEKATQVIIFSFIAMQDILQVAQYGASELKSYMTKYAKTLTERNLELLPNVQSFMSKLLLQNSVVSKLKEYLSLSGILTWVQNLVSSIVKMSQTFIFNFIARLSRSFSRIFTHLMAKFPTLANFTSLKKACEDLAQDPKVSDERRQKLKESVAKTNDLEKIVASFAEKRLENIVYRDPMDIFKSANVSAEICTKLYYGHEVSEEETDRVTLLRTGLEKSVLEETADSVNNLLFAQFVLADDEPRKTKIESELISNDVDAGKQEFEKVKTIEEIDVQIRELEKKIAYLKNDPDYEEGMSNLKRQIIVKSAQSTEDDDETVDVIAARGKKYEAQELIFKQRAGILKLEEEIEDLKARKRKLELSIAGSRSSRAKTSTIIIVLLSSLVFGVLGYHLYNNFKSYTEEATRTLFKPLLENSRQDPLLAAQIRMYAQEGNVPLMGSAPETLHEFQEWVHEKIHLIQIGKVSEEEIARKWKPMIAQSMAVNQLRDVQEQSSLWNWIAAPRKEKTYLGFGETNYNIPEAVSGQLSQEGVNALKGYADVVEYIPGKTPKSEDRTKIAYLLKAHNLYMQNAVLQTQDSMRDYEKGWVKTFKDFGSYLYSTAEKTGVTGTSFSFSGVLDGITSGAVPMIDQKISLLKASVWGSVAFLEFIMILITGIVRAVVNFSFGEAELATKEWKQLVVGIAAVIGVASAQILESVTNIFLGRWSVIWLVIRIFIAIYAVPFKSLKDSLLALPRALLGLGQRAIVGSFQFTKYALIRALQKEEAVLQEKVQVNRARLILKRKQKKIDYQIVSCNLCGSPDAIYECKKCGTFCSIGCNLLTGFL